MQRLRDRRRQRAATRQRIQVHPQRRRNLHLADSDSRRLILPQHFFLVLEHHGGVANVVADANVPPHDLLILTAEKLPLEEMDRIIREGENAPRLRLQAQMDKTSGFLFELVHPGRGLAEIHAG